MTKSSTQPRNCRRLVWSIAGSQHGAEAPVAERLDRAGEVGVDLEAARQQLRLDHLVEGLAVLAALGPARTRRAPSRRAVDRLVGRERRLAEREHPDDADREPDQPERQLGPA